MKKVADTLLSPMDENGNPRWFNVSYPVDLPDGSRHVVTLGGRVKRDENGRWEVDEVRGSTQAASLISDKLKSLHECGKIHDHIREELEKSYNI